MHHYLVNITTSRTYNQLRFKLSQLLADMNILTSGKKRKITQISNQIKASFARQSNIFEGMNIRYFGPVDGHDCINLVRILNEIKDYNGPKVLHIVTKRAKATNRPKNRPPNGMHQVSSIKKPENASSAIPADNPRSIRTSLAKRWLSWQKKMKK